jgi:hypothetical protein
VVFKPGKHLKEKVQNGSSNGHAGHPDDGMANRRPDNGQ